MGNANVFFELNESCEKEYKAFKNNLFTRAADWSRLYRFNLDASLVVIKSTLTHGISSGENIISYISMQWSPEDENYTHGIYTAAYDF